MAVFIVFPEWHERCAVNKGKGVCRKVGKRRRPSAAPQPEVENAILPDLSISGGLRWTTVCVLLVGGCASLTPAQNEALRDAQSFADAAMLAYRTGPILVLAGPRPPSVGATFERGTITLNDALVPSPFLDVLMAHELGHAVLGHEGPVSLKAKQVLTQRELDANAKAVEVLVRVQGKTEAEALRRVLQFLWSVQETLASRPRLELPLGHPPLCEQIDDLLRRFPRHQEWANAFGCAN